VFVPGLLVTLHAAHHDLRCLAVGNPVDGGVTIGTGSFAMHTVFNRFRISVDLDNAAVIPGIGFLMHVPMAFQAAFVGNDTFPCRWVESRGRCFTQNGQFGHGALSGGEQAEAKKKRNDPAWESCPYVQHYVFLAGYMHNRYEEATYANTPNAAKNGTTVPDEVDDPCVLHDIGQYYYRIIILAIKKNMSRLVDGYE
jgi:hypothetical protein